MVPWGIPPGMLFENGSEIRKKGISEKFSNRHRREEHKIPAPIKGSIMSVYAVFSHVIMGSWTGWITV
jgi:hypothetical protein